jgi:hypothetical protein
MTDRIPALIDGLRAAICDPECPLQFTPLLLECAQTLSAVIREKSLPGVKNDEPPAVTPNKRWDR